MKRNENESLEQYLDRICTQADKHCENLDNIFKDMKEKGITICSECGCDKYSNKEHNCNID